MKPQGLRLTFVNVGYGEAILLESEEGFTMLVDGGSADESEYQGNATGRIRLDEYLREREIDKIDLMVCTHIHEDHISGLLPVVKRITPHHFWQNLPMDFANGKRPIDFIHPTTLSGKKFLSSLNDYLDLASTLEKRGTIISQMAEDEKRMELPGGITLRLVGPSMQREETLVRNMQAIWDSNEQEAAFRKADLEMNNYSLMMVLEYANRRIFLPGDTNRDGFAGITGEIQADIFKVGHHGQADAITRETFQKIHPSMVVCCASSDRRYQSAAPSILSMMREEGASLYFSDCPQVDGMSIPTHQALTFTISPSGTIDTHYSPI